MAGDEMGMLLGVSISAMGTPGAAAAVRISPRMSRMRTALTMIEDGEPCSDLGWRSALQSLLNLRPGLA
jgi:hypothetical protein